MPMKIMYLWLRSNYLVPGRFQDTLRIVVFRKNLSKSLRNPESKTLMLTLVAGGDFQLGIEDGREMKLSVRHFVSASLVDVQ